MLIPAGTSPANAQPLPELPDQAPPLPEDPATVIAVVGQSPILWGDVQPKVDGRINEVLASMGREFPKSELAKARLQLARSAMIQAIQTKMMKESFLIEQVGTEAADKRKEMGDMMLSRARQMFFDNELKELQKKYETTDLAELDQKMRETGSSLRARQRDFIDMMLGHMYMRSMVDQDPKVTIAEINARYHKDVDAYRHGAKARWEQLSILFENHPDRMEAKESIVALGREAYFGGNLQAVAKAKSEEPFAVDGGLHDWTTKGALASEPLDTQIFSIPLNKMSEIIEDQWGFHIVRVLERKPAGVQPLAELQEEIRAQIKKEKIAKAQEAMLVQMRKRVPVWSIYPDDVPGSKPLRIANAARGSQSDNSPSSGQRY
ncbi:peptidyl-prolyl cis-trans isomerase [Roseiconus nitratireducens]|uniref:Periplasmic chaperone PpiD n=1 Tax=Roseiconus nitratireducens TaxID=2605748 RepID=A0A5M6D116_9BACT|nr:peptidylprolyl isomerase [Roseiconus nitratireducens]KAA5539309.1 peptidyl-prolyl cis-trans isomerase [Roseiconus nitratireducens]